MTLSKKTDVTRKTRVTKQKTAETSSPIPMEQDFATSSTDKQEQEPKVVKQKKRTLSPEEYKANKKRKVLHEEIARSYYGLKDRKRELKEELKAVKSSLATLKRDFPSFLGVIEGMIQTKSNKQQLDQELQDLRNRVTELEAKDTLPKNSENELKNKKRRITTLTAENRNLETFQYYYRQGQKKTGSSEKGKGIMRDESPDLPEIK